MRVQTPVDAEIVVAHHLDEAFAGVLLLIERHRVLEIAEDDVDLGGEILDLGADLFVMRRHEMDHALELDGKRAVGLGGADGEGREMFGGRARRGHRQLSYSKAWEISRTIEGDGGRCQPEHDFRALAARGPRAGAISRIGSWTRLLAGTKGEGPMIEVTNQPPPLENYNLFSSDTVLREAWRANMQAGPMAISARSAAVSARAEMIACRRRRQSQSPVLRAFDRYGHRIDEVDFHPSWHKLLGLALDAGLHSRSVGGARDGCACRSRRRCLHAGADRKRRLLPGLDDVRRRCRR